MRKKIFTFLLALAASVGMSWASVTWISDQYGNEKGYNAGTPFTKDGVTVTMSDNAFFNVSYWGDASLQCINGTFDPTAGNYVFSNSLGENFVKIIIAAGYPSEWEWFPKGDGWVLSGDEYNGYILTWTGNASTVTLMDNELHSVNQSIEGDIVFYFESDIPAWVKSGDTWDESTKTLTVNSNTGNSAYASQTDIKHLIVGDEVTELGWGTFFFDSLMTTVELGNNLETIGISAFNECRSLSTITVPASVTYIGVRAFRYCTSLTTFTCEAVTPPTIGNAIFENANNLTAIYVPAASVDAYKSAWSDYASLIEAIGGGSAPATNPIVIATNTGQSSYTQGSITVSVGNVGDSDGFRLNDDNPASISNSGSSTISKIELVPGWFLNKHSYVRANGAEPNSSSEELITFLNVNSNEVTLSCSVSIYIKEVRIYFEEAAPAGNVKLIEFQVPASWENDNSPITSADFPDFVATTYEIASALPVTSEPSIVIFDFPGDDEVSVYSKLGGQVSQPSTGAIKRENFFDQQTQIHYYYTVLEGSDPTPQPVVLADCGLGWKNVPEGGVVGTIGHEDEIVLPQVNASLDFILAFQAHTATLRLGSTDESVLAVYGFNNFAVNGVGECDVYVVHDEDAVFAYDSAAFHVTVNPEPTPQPEDVNIIPNVDPQNAGVYYSTFYDSANKYALPDGVEAYVATRDGANLLLSKIADAGQTIPANNAVILKSTVTPFTLTPSDAEAVPVNAINSLEGSEPYAAGAKRLKAPSARMRR